MTRLVRTSFVAALGVLILAAGVTASAQTPVTAEDAAKFIGAWALGLDTPQGAMTLNLTLKDEAGKVSGQVTSDMMPEAPITSISKDGDSLVLKYSLDFQGQAIPVIVTIIPVGDKWKSNFDFAGGQFMMDGTAIKK